MDSTEIAVFGLGTLGDILPLIIFSVELLNTTSSSQLSRIHFVTNVAHQKHVEKYFPFHDVTTRGKQVFFAQYVSNPPLNFKPLQDSFLSMHEINIISEMMALNVHIKVVIANLFCLSGWLVAEKLGVRCILLHPHKPHSERPSSFLLSLKTTAPYFHRRIFFDGNPGHCVDLAFLETVDNSSTISWLDYEEWLWPTLTSFYESTRQQLKLEDISSPSYVPPLNPLVLLAISPYFYPVPGYWPSNRYIVSGMILPDHVSEKRSDNWDGSLSSDLSALLLCKEYPTVCIDFGSMTELLIQHYDWRVFCKTIKKVCGFSFLILCHQYHAVITEYFENSDSMAVEMKKLNDEKLNCGSECLELPNNIMFVGGHVSHSDLFKQCAAILHHGGVGTMGTALHAGIPQLVMPLIHDQYSNADRLEYLGYAPPSLPREVLFPDRTYPSVRTKCVIDNIDLDAIMETNTSSSSSASSSRIVCKGEEDRVDQIDNRTTKGRAHLPISNPIQEEREKQLDNDKKASVMLVSQAVEAAVIRLEKLLRFVTNPPHRLKCACLGRDLRQDPLENGLKNCCAVVLEELQRSSDRCVDRSCSIGGTARYVVGEKSSPNVLLDSSLELQNNSNASRSNEGIGIESGKRVQKRVERNNETEEVEVDDENGREWQDFPKGLRLATHHATAPEETEYLYEEIFKQKAYMQHGIKLNEEDLIVDVGANIGFFSVFAELQFDTPNALDIIAIEPCAQNYVLLEKNMKKYAPRATLFQCAILNLEERGVTDITDQNRSHQGNASELNNSTFLTTNESCTITLRSNVPVTASVTVSESDNEEACHAANPIVLSKDRLESQHSHTRKKLKSLNFQAILPEIPISECVMMTFYPRMPGNSLTSIRAEKTKVSKETGTYGSKGRLHSYGSPYLIGAVQQECSARTLSSVIDEWNRNRNSEAVAASEGEGMKGSSIATKETRQRRIALLKIDVEGSEVEALLSLELRHWELVDQVIIETARPLGSQPVSSPPDSIDIERFGSCPSPFKNISALEMKKKKRNNKKESEIETTYEEEESGLDIICTLLRNLGFKIYVESDPSDGTDTGCVLVFASRYDQFTTRSHFTSTVFK